MCFVRIVTEVKAKKKSSDSRKRNIQWDISLDDLAVQLAFELGYFPEKRNGGVSKMLSDLVLKEKAKVSRPIIPSMIASQQGPPLNPEVLPQQKKVVR
jgi:hypothetical protein